MDMSVDNIDKIRPARSDQEIKEARQKWNGFLDAAIKTIVERYPSKTKKKTVLGISHNVDEFEFLEKEKENKKDDPKWMEFYYSSMSDLLDVFLQTSFDDEKDENGITNGEKYLGKDWNGTGR